VSIGGGSTSRDEWSRVRGAYAALIADKDPWKAQLAAGAFDLRVGYGSDELNNLSGDTVVVSGPGDLAELREIVERMTGPATWPVSTVPTDFEIIETRSATLHLVRPAIALGLVMAMEGHIEDRARAWRTWKTAVESLAGAISPEFQVTIEASLAGRA